MVRDKALLPVPGGGLLWERQLGVLRALEPTELFISGPSRPGFPEDIRLLTDEQPGLGPLSGIAAALTAMTTPRLVVLAIDLPAMDARFLRNLLAHAELTHSGMVPKWPGPDGYCEPLAAVYPSGCLKIAQQRLQAGKLALQGFVHACGALIQPHDLTGTDKPLFINWNEPGTPGIPG